MFETDSYGDENGHGTACASIIKKELNSVELIAVKVLDKFGNSNLELIEEGLRFILESDIRIVLMNISVKDGKDIKRLHEICCELLNSHDTYKYLYQKLLLLLYYPYK